MSRASMAFNSSSRLLQGCMFRVHGAASRPVVRFGAGGAQRNRKPDDPARAAAGTIMEARDYVGDRSGEVHDE